MFTMTWRNYGRNNFQQEKIQYVTIPVLMLSNEVLKEKKYIRTIRKIHLAAQGCAWWMIHEAYDQWWWILYESIMVLEHSAALDVSVDGTYLGSLHSPCCQWGCSRSGWFGCLDPPSGGGGACGNRLMLPQVLRRWSAALGFHRTPDQTAQGKNTDKEKHL